MPKTHLDRMGWILDSNFRTNGLREYLREKVQVAQDVVYRLGHAVAGARVDSLLKSTSSVPTVVSEVPLRSRSLVVQLSATQNSFCERLERLKQSGKEFDISQMMVVDLLHEFELGVWKALLTHLIRLLHAASKQPGALVDILNARYVRFNTEESMLMLSKQIPSGSYVWTVHHTAFS